METTRLSNVQQELLKLFARNVADNDLLNIKQLLSNYFLQQAIDGADALWDERGYTEELMQQWRQESRAPAPSQPHASR